MYQSYEPAQFDTHSFRFVGFHTADRTHNTYTPSETERQNLSEMTEQIELLSLMLSSYLDNNTMLKKSQKKTKTQNKLYIENF